MWLFGFVHRWPPFALVPILDGVALYLVLIVYARFFRSVESEKYQWEFGSFVPFGIAFFALSFLLGFGLLLLLSLISPEVLTEDQVFQLTICILVLWRILWVKGISSIPWKHAVTVTAIQGALILPTAWVFFRYL